MLLIAEPINGVLPSSDGSLVKLSLRYGKAKKKMTVRWFSEANVKFPDANIGRTGMEMDMFRNDYEQIFESDVDN